MREIKLIVKQILCIILVKYWDKYTELHGQQNDKYTEMHGQQNDKYTEMHGQQNDKYTEMHGQQNDKTIYPCLLQTVIYNQFYLKIHNRTTTKPHSARELLCH